MFTDKFSGYAGESISCEVDGFTCTATLHGDDDTTPPWEREDGHGPVSDWTRRGKAPGELVLCDDNPTGLRGNTQRRFYDFAGTCKIALRDHWGVSPYRLDIEHGSNGLKQANAQWFQGRELLSFRSDWCDDINAAIQQVYAAHRATMTPRAYAAAAARADYDRLRRWCDDQWQYVGVAVTVEREDVQLTGPYDHALWGIESDAGDYLAEVACELLPEALESARQKIAALSA